MSDPTSAQTPVLQQHRAAASSARARYTRRLLRDMASAPALTIEQRTQIVTAAAQLRLVDTSASNPSNLGGAA